MGTGIWVLCLSRNMERLSFIRAQPWFEPDVRQSRDTQEQLFAGDEIFEGIATFEEGQQLLGFRASPLASSLETRVRVALRRAGADSGGAGIKRRLDGACTNPAEVGSVLLLRFEAAGSYLQGRLLHTHIRELTDNVSNASASCGVSAVAIKTRAFLRMRLAALDLIIMPLPELSVSAGMEQVQRLLTHMLQLPTLSAEPPPKAPRARVSAVLDPPQVVSRAPVPTDAAWLADVDHRTAHWDAFVRCAGELATRLEGMASASSEPPEAPLAITASGAAASGSRPSASNFRPWPSSDPAVAAMLRALPVHFGQAMPPTSEAARAIQADADTQSAEAEASFVHHAVHVLAGTPAPSLSEAPRQLAATAQSETNPVECLPQRNADSGMAATADGETNRGMPTVEGHAIMLDKLDQLRDRLRDAYKARLALELLPRR